MSYLGGDDDFYTEQYVSRNDAYFGDGVYIPYNDIVQNWPYSDPGIYYANPLHISVVPLDEYYKFLPEFGGALVIFVSAVPFDYTDDCDSPEFGTQWCEDNEICCYLKADDASGYTLQYPPGEDYAYKNMSGYPEACFGPNDVGSQLTDVQYVDGGSPENSGWISSLNNMIKAINEYYAPSEQIYNIRIVIDPKTTIEFPLSNYYILDDGSRGYDVLSEDNPEGRISITGFGRIDGYPASFADLYRTNLFTQQPMDGTELDVRKRLLWITGNGQGNSGSGWHTAEALDGSVPYYYANGKSADSAENNGEDVTQYGVVVQHIQIGYAPPLNDSPVVLGDFNYGSDTDSEYGAGYGASVLVEDTKFISFRKTSDGIAMRNPVSFGKGNFIHGSDDLQKTVTGIDGVMWKSLALTIFAGHYYYGSIASPCTFGPASKFQKNIPACLEVLFQDVLVPIAIYNNDYDQDALAANYYRYAVGIKIRNSNQQDTSVQTN